MKTSDRMKPFVGSTRGKDWPEGGYLHPQDVANRHLRRAAFKTSSSRKTRMIVRDIKRQRRYGDRWAPTSKRDSNSHSEG